MKKVEKLAKEIRDSMQGWERDLEGHLESINDILNKHAPIEKSFPKHMMCINDLVDTNMIVIFYDNRKGAVAKEATSNSISKLGYQSSEWVMKYFVDCDVEIQVKP